MIEYISIIKVFTLIPPKLKHNNIETRESSIHEMGVFATHDIPKDTIVCFYPAHLLVDEEINHTPVDKDGNALLLCILNVDQ